MITQEYLKSILNYNSENGIFIWKHRPLIRKTWNTRYVGKIAGHADKNGYIQISIDSIFYQAHHLAWLYVYGFLPKQLDHKNLIPGDNKILNLRESTQSQNRFNTRITKINTSGYKGVTLHKKTKKWQAATFLNGKYHYLGLFSSAKEAHVAYCNFTRINHGEFVRFA